MPDIGFEKISIDWSEEQLKDAKDKQDTKG